MIKIRKALRISRNERASRKQRNRVCCSHARKLKVVFVGTEVAPWSKVGGLGDVLSALPIALAEKGHDVMTIAPRYDSYPDIHDTGLNVPITGKTDLDGIERQGINVARLFCSVVKSVYRVFVDHPVFTREKISTPEGRRPLIYPYSPTGSDEQFEVGCNVLNQSAIFAPSLIWSQDSDLVRTSQNHSQINRKDCSNNDVVSTLERLSSGDDWITCKDSREGEEVVFICNDWPCALLPYFLQSPVHRAILQTSKASKTTNGQISNLTSSSPLNIKRNPLGNSKVLFLIHNLDHTGPSFHQSLNKLEIETYPSTQSNNKSSPSNQGCHTGRKKDPSWLDIGLKHSDQVVTVSPSYAEEISNHEILKKHLKATSLIGITNGIDTSIWNSETDKFLHTNLRFGLSNFQEGKQKAKRFLQRKLGLEIDEESPFFGFIGRLDKQKGVDLLLTAILKFYTNQSSQFHPKAQFVLLGCGDPILESHLSSIKYWFRGKACGINRFSESLAHEITAASDFLLVPSRVEPCGLVTLSALKYGTIPITSGVGGLKDLHYQSPPLGLQIMNKTSPVLGGLDHQAERLLDAIKEGIKLHKSEEFEVWRKQCFLKDVSWDRPASQWEDLLFSLSSI